LGGQDPHTPGMFSPSFMDAMEGAAAAAAAGMSSPMFYSVASPYTPIHAHHHSFSMPSGAQQGHSTGGMFHSGLSVGTFGGGETSSLDHNSTSLSSVGSAEDFSAGLQISMNAAVAAAMSNAGSYDDNSTHNRSGSNASAFSRVQQGASGVSQMLGGGQPNGGLNMDIGTTLASFANIPGLEPFPSASMERRQTFASGDHHHHSSTPFGMLSTEPSSMFHSMDAALHGSAGAPLMGIAGSLTHDGLITSPAMESAAGMQSPTAAARRSRKRAATVSAIRNEDLPHHHQQSPSSATSMMSVSMQSMHNGMLMTRASSDSSAYTGPVFNSQAVVTGTGSKVVMVLTSKVAQKSYGTEKRFLCPPPTILLFGDSWKLPTTTGDISAHGNDFIASMPRISVSVPTSDGSSQVSDFGDGLSSSSSDSRTAQLEWLARPELASKPKQHVPHNPVPPQRAPRDGDPITGRYVAKQLFINDVDEKRKRVAVKVRLHDPSGQVVLNEFESRPIKVISKPSKKRQSVKNIDLCIHHGSTISLFNRLRSQTVSTKYLGATRSMSVGGPRPFWFPAGGAEESAAADSLAEGSSAATTTFVARNSVWDPFIIWIVNTQLDQAEIEAFNDRIAENPTPIPGYPTPPTFALHPQCPPDLDGGCTSASGSSGGDQSHMDGDAIGQPQPREPIPILYNQPIILQCVSTGMCSPVLTLRKVEKGSIAIGSFYGRDQSRDVLGDPVSQLHKVAFEVRVQTRDELPAVTVTPAGLNTRVGSYLTCMGDIVGLNATCDGRQLTSDGTESSSSSAKPTAGGARGSPATQAARKQAKDCASAGTTSWAEDVGDNAVWTMVGTDCAIYRFDYPPSPNVMAQLQQAASASSSSSMSAANNMSSATGIMPLHGSLTLPPTPTSPHGMQDYSQHNKLQQQQQQPFSLEMMLAEHGATGGFQSVGMDASLAAAVYGIGMATSVGDSLPPQLLSSSMLAAAAAAASNSHGDLAHHRRQHQQSYGSNEGRGMHMTGDNNMVPIVFKSAVQNPPTINPSTLFGGDGGTVSATERSYITLHGLNFTPDMVVVFDGQHSLFTEYKSAESISCLGPLASDFADDSAVVAVAGNDNGDDDYMGEYAMIDDSKQQGRHPTSPSESDSSSTAASSSVQSSDDVRPFASLNGTDASKSRSQRASSTDSTASSATATPSSHGASAPLSKSDGSAASRGLAKGSGSVVKVPIYLSRNGGAGPTYKTGQFYTLHM
ncbi:hypothetical protein IW146_008727, partial [Coemansia sp. RSA 922]